MTMLGVNCKHVGWADLPQSEQETNSSADRVFLFSAESPKQKSQYWLGDAEPFPELLLWPKNKSTAELILSSKKRKQFLSLQSFTTWKS